MFEASPFIILIYLLIAVYSIAVISLTFKLISLCKKFNELMMIVRRHAGVREYNGKLYPIDEDGMIQFNKEG